MGCKNKTKDLLLFFLVFRLVSLFLYFFSENGKVFLAYGRYYGIFYMVIITQYCNDNFVKGK